MAGLVQKLIQRNVWIMFWQQCSLKKKITKLISILNFQLWGWVFKNPRMKKSMKENFNVLQWFFEFCNILTCMTWDWGEEANRIWTNHNLPCKIQKQPIVFSPNSNIQGRKVKQVGPPSSIILHSLDHYTSEYASIPFLYFLHQAQSLSSRFLKIK